MGITEDFTSIPVLDYALTKDPATRPKFLEDLRDSLVYVGFFYISNPPVSLDDFNLVVDYTPKMFEIPQEKKDKLLMQNSSHFMGYVKMGDEYTKGKVDSREQYELATDYQNHWKPGDPDYLRLWGNAQWPDEEDIPGFKETFVRCLEQLRSMDRELMELIAESLGLEKDSIGIFFDPKSPSRGKVIKYPPINSGQGVGPHYDPGFLTFLLQITTHVGLQVQNPAGDWIDVPPIPGTFVVNIGKGLETATCGLTRAASHRAVSPPVGTFPRYSLVFTQNIAQSVRLGEVKLDFPKEVLALREKRRAPLETDSVNYLEYQHECSGQTSLLARIKSHPDVGQRYYPELFHKLFPEGIKA